MSKLRDFIKANMLDHDETTLLKKEHARLAKRAFKLTGLKNCKYVPYMRHGMTPETKALFPESATSIDALIIAPFTKDGIMQIAELAKTDTEIRKLTDEWENDAAKQEPHDCL